MQRNTKRSLEVAARVHPIRQPAIHPFRPSKPAFSRHRLERRPPQQHFETSGRTDHLVVLAGLTLAAALAPLAAATVAANPRFDRNSKNGYFSRELSLSRASTLMSAPSRARVRGTNTPLEYIYGYMSKKSSLGRAKDHILQRNSPVLIPIWRPHRIV